MSQQQTNRNRKLLAQPRPVNQCTNAFETVKSRPLACNTDLNIDCRSLYCRDIWQWKLSPQLQRDPTSNCIYTVGDFNYTGARSRGQQKSRQTGMGLVCRLSMPGRKILRSAVIVWLLEETEVIFIYCLVLFNFCRKLILMKCYYPDNFVSFCVIQWTWPI